MNISESSGNRPRRFLIIGGLVGLALAFLWWLLFYASISKQVGISFSDALPCLIITTSRCSIVQGMAGLVGYIPYTPIIFWGSLILLMAGYVVAQMASDEAYGASSTSQSLSYDKAKWDALLEYDSDIANAAAKITPLGQRWVDKFAESYLALNDKSYLPTILQKVLRDAEADKPIHEGVYQDYSYKEYADGRIEAVMYEGELCEFKSKADFVQFVNIEATLQSARPPA